MSTMPPKELLRLWQTERLTDEMAIGHIIQNLVNLQKSIDAVNTSYFRLSADVDELKKLTRGAHPSRQKNS